MECYDPRTRQWSSVPSMRQARAFHGMATLGELIYVSGGTAGVECFASVEAFDPATGLWKDVRPMATARAFHSMAAFEGKLFVCGGKDNHNQLLDSLEIYDPVTDKWEAGPRLHRARRALQLVGC